MNQSIFVIRRDFFDNPLGGLIYTKKLIDENCHSEKLALIYDPVAEDFFNHVAKSDKDIFEEVVSNFYSGIEAKSGLESLSWYQLDEVVNFHLTFLNPLLYEINDRFGGYLMGCLPLMHYEPVMYLYFCMSKYDIEDVYLLMSGPIYLKLLRDQIDAFNKLVLASNKKDRVITSKSVIKSKLGKVDL